MISDLLHPKVVSSTYVRVKFGSENDISATVESLVRMMRKKSHLKEKDVAPFVTIIGSSIEDLLEERKTGLFKMFFSTNIGTFFRLEGLISFNAKVPEMMVTYFGNAFRGMQSPEALRLEGFVPPGLMFLRDLDSASKHLFFYEDLFKTLIKLPVPLNLWKTATYAGSDKTSLCVLQSRPNTDLQSQKLSLVLPFGTIQKIVGNDDADVWDHFRKYENDGPNALLSFLLKRDVSVDMKCPSSENVRKLVRMTMASREISFHPAPIREKKPVLEEP